MGFLVGDVLDGEEVGFLVREGGGVFVNERGTNLRLDGQSPLIDSKEELLLYCCFTLLLLLAAPMLLKQMQGNNLWQR